MRWHAASAYVILEDVLLFMEASERMGIACSRTACFRLVFVMYFLELQFHVYFNLDLCILLVWATI